jgi:branched-chain amino acid transport system permease protein
MLIQLLIGALTTGSMYGVIGLGFSLIYKASGLVTFCQGEFMMIGAFVGLTLFKTVGLPMLPTILLTTIILFVLGMIVERLFISSLLTRGSGLAYILLCTIAVSLLMQNSAMLIWTSRTLSFPPLFNVATIKIGTVNIVPESLVVLTVGVLCMVGLHVFMQSTRYGTAMRAAALDPKAANALGINVHMTNAVTWGIAAALAGAIGCAVGPIMSVYATMGASIGMKGFSGAVVGGYGNMYGAIVGGMFFGFLEAFVSAYLTSTYRDLVSFLALVVFMTVMPTGLFKADVAEH